MASQQQGGELDGGRLLVEVANQNPRLGQLIQNIIDGVNATARNVGVSATGNISAPKSPDTVSVKVAAELMHISVSHSGPLQRGIRYFSEISTSPSFAQPLVIDHGSSRTSHPISLPTQDDNGNPQSYYVRSYAQNPGGPPSTAVMAGGGPFTMAGTTQMTLLPSTGSGTAPNTGQSAGQGLGKFQKRQQ